jgi:hypothetical protein
VLWCKKRTPLSFSAEVLDGCWVSYKELQGADCCMLPDINLTKTSLFVKYSYFIMVHFEIGDLTIVYSHRLEVAYNVRESSFHKRQLMEYNDILGYKHKSMFFRNRHDTVAGIFGPSSCQNFDPPTLTALQTDSKLLVHIGAVWLHSDGTVCLTVYVIRVSMKFRSWI